MSDSPSLAPPQLRHRASSTTLAPSQPPRLLLQNPPTRPSMLATFLSHLRIPTHTTHHFSSSSSPSPISSSDDFVLPLSASVHTIDPNDSPPYPAHPPHPWWLRIPSVHASILFVIILFPLSTALVLACLSTLPTSVSWPRNLADLAQLGRDLHGYSQSGPGPMAHVIGIMAITAVWKHAWSIPGSVVWNVLAGALFSPSLATILLTALTTIGSACATLLSVPFTPLLSHLFPRALDMTRAALEGHQDAKSSSPAWVRLSVLRLIGIVPWSGINIACGVCGVPIKDCILGTFIGTLPWTAVTCQIGDILQTVASTPSPTPQSLSSLLTSPWIIFKLIILSFLSLAPILARERLRGLIALSASPVMSHKHAFPTNDERVSRWTWVHDWRSKIRLHSHSRTREGSRKELEALVQEKGNTLPS